MSPGDLLEFKDGTNLVAVMAVSEIFRSTDTIDVCKIGSMMYLADKVNGIIVVLVSMIDGETDIILIHKNWFKDDDESR